MWRETLRPDVHVGRAAQPVDVPPDGELLAQLVADPVAHVLVPDVALRAAAGHLHHDELLALPAPGSVNTGATAPESASPIALA